MTKRQKVPLPIVPSAYAWVRFGRVCLLGFAVTFVVGEVLLFAFHIFWIPFVGAAFALAGIGGALASYLQSLRESNYQYTTLPWQSGTLELRDPADGWIISATNSGNSFDSLKKARAQVADSVAGGLARDPKPNP